MTLPATTQSTEDKRDIALLKAIGLDKVAPEQRELALAIAGRYELDLMLKHLVLIEGRPFITRDGLLHIAHRSGVFDGMEVETPTLEGGFWQSAATVYRKDMTRGFRYPGRYPEAGKNRIYGPEMAIKVAESMALRRAFDIAAPSVDERWDNAAEVTPAPPAQSLAEVARAKAEPLKAGPIERFTVLTGAEVFEAEACGRQRYEGRKGRDRLGFDSTEAHRIGALAERAFVRWLNDNGIDWPWSCSVDLYGGAPDIGPVQVRAASNGAAHYGVKVKSNDAPQRPVVGVQMISGDTFRMRGWVFAKDARKDEYLKDPGDIGKPNWFVPDEDLHPMSDLLAVDWIAQEFAQGPATAPDAPADATVVSEGGEVLGL